MGLDFGFFVDIMGISKVQFLLVDDVGIMFVEIKYVGGVIWCLFEVKWCFFVVKFKILFFFVMWVGNMKMYKMWGFIGCMFNLIGVFYFWCGVMDGLWLD